MSPSGAGGLDRRVQAQRAQLLEVAELVHRRTGIAIGRQLLSLLTAAIERIRPGLGAKELLGLIASRELGEWALDRLIDEVAVKETYFFRNGSELERIAWKPGMRVWNPGCATGEEAYTMAIMARAKLGSAGSSVSILATDIACASLAAAHRGIYGIRSLRNVPAQLRRRHFLAAATGAYEIDGDARRPVRLARHNLVADPIPPAGEARFDVIVCRNVLIYFDTDTATRTAAALRAALVPDGLLVLGAADRLAVRPAPREAPPQRPIAPRKLPLTLPEDGVAVPQPAESLDPQADFVDGVALNASGDAAGAVRSLRRALYLATNFPAAAFELGRACESLGDAAAARRAYQRALDPDQQPWRPLGSDPADDLAEASRTRLDRLAGE